MKCTKCRHENPEGAKFCIECGGPMEFHCPKCGAKTPSTGKFCMECAHPLRDQKEEAAVRDLSFDEKIAKIQRYLPEGLTEKILSQRDRIEGERKQVTVMFCDLEGFTALTERLGPEEAYSVMDDIYEILIHKVHDYEGTVNEMTGDGIVALFGAPIALEDAPQRAIRSAMAIHREMTRFSDKMRKERAGALPLKMRIGIHSGPVVVGTLGNDLRVEFKAVGDTVNLASRMEELAKPGTTYVTADTFKLTEGLFRYEALGGKDIKGKEEPVTAYQVIAPSTRRTRFDVSAERGLTPFVGRERELELLLDGFERAKEGRGQAFSVVAEAGLGKSRLLYEFRKAVGNEDMTFLEGRCLSYSKGIAYHPIIDILKSYFQVQESDDDLRINLKVRKALERVRVDLASTLPFFLDLLSVEEIGHEKMSLSPEAKRVRIIEVLKTIILQGSQLRTLVMAFEDLHWADKTSEDVLQSLMDSIPGARILLIFTYRPEFVHTWGGKSFHSQVTLNRLSNRESLAMVTCLLGSEAIDNDLEDLILQKAEGVPFFIEEFVKSLKDLRIIERKNNRYHLMKDIQRVSIPSTIQDVIMARVDSLPEVAKEVLQTGAVIDREFSYELIKRVSGLPEQDLLSRLSALRDSELLYERGIFPESNYVFKHALTQEVAYNGLLEKRRKEIHEKIARAIEDIGSERLEEYFELLAYHYVRSDEKQKAVEYLDLANQKSFRASAMEDAKAYFDQAMKILDSLPDTVQNRKRKISLLVSQAEVSNLLFRVREYYDLLTPYKSLAVQTDDPGLVGAFYARLGWSEAILGLFDEAIEHATTATKLCEAVGNAEDTGFAYMVLVWIHSFKGDFDKAIAFKEEAVRQMNEQFNLRVYVRAHYLASYVYAWLGQWDRAEEEGRTAVSIAQNYGDNSVIAVAAFYFASVHLSRGDVERALELAELAMEKAPTPGDRIWAQGALAIAWCYFGQAERGLESLESLAEVIRAGRHFPSLLYGFPWFAQAYFLTGRHDKAGQTAREVMQLAERVGARPCSAWSYRLLGEIALETNPEEALPHFEKAISIFKEIKAENQLALAYAGMGRLHKQQGNTEQAREYLTQALEIFERLGTLLEPDKVREELAELPQ